MKQLTIPFRKSRVKIPLVDIFIEGAEENLSAIVDTGSESTIFDTDFVDEYGLLTTNSWDMSLADLKGEDKPITIKEVDTYIAFGDEEVKLHVTGISADLSGVKDHIKNKYKEPTRITCILGNDFLRKYKTKINYKTKEITLYYDLSGE